jgi:hypothetical protein
MSTFLCHESFDCALGRFNDCAITSAPGSEQRIELRSRHWVYGDGKDRGIAL